MTKTLSAQFNHTVRRLVTTGLAAGAVAATASLVAPTTASAAPSVCGKMSAAKCQVVAHVDVDGDGAKDAVAIVPKKIDKHGYAHATRVRVKTADGKLMKKTIKHTQWSANHPPYRGAATIDGRKGHELVLTHQVGAHTMWYRVLTVRNGRLTTLAAPKLPGTTKSKDWFTDSALNSTGGINRHKGKAPVLIFKYGTRTSAGAGVDRSPYFSGRTVRVRWQHGGWKRISVTKHHWAPKTATKIAGWHLKGLKGM